MSQSSLNPPKFPFNICITMCASPSVRVAFPERPRLEHGWWACCLIGGQLGPSARVIRASGLSQSWPSLVSSSLCLTLNACAPPQPTDPRLRLVHPFLLPSPCTHIKLHCRSNRKLSIFSHDRQNPSKQHDINRIRHWLPTPSPLSQLITTGGNFPPTSDTHPPERA